MNEDLVLKSNRYKPYLRYLSSFCIFLVFSTALHVGLFKVLSLARVVESKVIPSPHAVDLNLIITDEAKQLPPERSPSHELQKVRAKSTNHSTKTSRKASSQPVDKELKYEDFLQANSAQDLRSITTGESSRQKYVLPQAAQEILSEVKVPIALRRDQWDGKAQLSTEKTEGGLLISSLTGDPFLRAALYISVRDPKHRTQYLELFDTLQTKSYRIVLTIQSLSVDQQSGPVFNTDYSLDGTVIRVRYKVYKPSFYYSKVMNLLNFKIPDDDVERSKRRDKSELHELSSSPAFQHEVHNFKID